VKLTSFLAGIAFITILLPAPSFAGNEKGNGDLSHVCRDATGAITRDDVLDLYRGVNELHLDIQESKASVEDQVNQAVARLSGYVDLYNFTLDYFPANFATHGYGIAGQLKDGPAGVPLTNTGDDLPPPSADGCPYEQLAVYTPGGDIVVQPELLSHLTSTGKAAFYLHEALYVLARTYSGAADSLVTQELVAHLFEQVENPDSIKKLVGQLFVYLPEYQHCMRRALPALLNDSDTVIVRLVPISHAGIPNYANFKIKVNLSLIEGNYANTINVSSVPILFTDTIDFELPIAARGLHQSLVNLDGLYMDPVTGQPDMPTFELQILQGSKVLSSWNNRGECSQTQQSRWWIPLR